MQSLELTCLLNECSWLALSIVRQSDDTKLIIDTRLKPIHGVVVGCRQNRVLKDGYTLARSHHGDLITCDGCGVERRPVETDGGVTDVLEGEVGQLWDVWRDGGRGGKKRKYNGNTTEDAKAGRKEKNQT